MAVALAAAVAMASATVEGRAESCSLLGGDPAVDFYSTPDTYAFLRELDEEGCGTVSLDEFEEFTAPLDLNVVSFPLLEERLLAPEDREDGRLVLEEYVARSRAAAEPLNEAVLISLVDAAYYSCEGDEACIAERVSALIGDAPLTAAASCLYGMSGSCGPSELPRGMTLLNEATLLRQASPEDARRERAEFLCTWYRDCAD